MLYEVITNLIVPNIKDADTLNLVGITKKMNARITSYNVCYTKVLRYRTGRYIADVLPEADVRTIRGTHERDQGDLEIRSLYQP